MKWRLWFKENSLPFIFNEKNLSLVSKIDILPFKQYRIQQIFQSNVHCPLNETNSLLGSSPTNHLQTNTTTSNRKPNLDISSSSSTVIREKSNISILETGQGRSHGRRWWQRWRSQAVFTYVSRVQIQIVSEKGSLDACFDTRRGERETERESEREREKDSIVWLIVEIVSTFR